VDFDFNFGPKLLTRLLIKEWLKVFLGAATVLLMLVGVANIISELMRAATTLPDILLHFFLDIPMWLGKILPISCLVGTLFSLSALQRRNELVAMLSCGLSRYSLLSTIAFLSFSVGLLQFGLSGFLRPYSEHLKNFLLVEGGRHFRSSSTEGIKSHTMSSGKIWYKNSAYFCSLLAYNKDKKEINDISFYYYNDHHNFEKMITAESGQYLQDKTWLLKNGKEVSRMATKEFQLEESFADKKVELGEVPADFEDIDSDITELFIGDLYRYIKKVHALGINVDEYLILFYENFSGGLLCFVFGLLSCQAVFSPGRRHSSFGKSVVFILVFTIFFWLGHSSVLALGSGQKISPAIASFFFPLLCFVYIVRFFVVNRKLS
jgi:lipopolysaccharide export system permease protein